jgi:hypothetical protein
LGLLLILVLGYSLGYSDVSFSLLEKVSQ